MSISTESVESSRGDSRKSSNLLSDLEEVIQDGGASSGHQCGDSSDGRNSYAGSRHHHGGTTGKGCSTNFGEGSHHQQHGGSTGEGRGSYETGFLRRGGATADDRNNSFAMAGHHQGGFGEAFEDDPNSNNRCPYLNADDDSVNHNLTTTTTSDDLLGLSDSDSLGSSYDNLGSDDKGRYEDLLDNSAYSKYFKFTYTNSEIFHLGKIFLKHSV